MRIPLSKRIMLNVHRKVRHTQARLHDLTYLFWECTLRCNLDCLHCGSDCRRGDPDKDMPLKVFLDVLDRIAQRYPAHTVQLALTGGEPLLRTDLDACGHAFRERGFRWGMVSNGYMLDAERLNRLLHAGLGSLTISLDGLKDTHNWMRGRPDSYDRALRAIECAAPAGLAFDVVTCVNQRNQKELGTLRDILMERGVTAWRLFTIFPKGRAQDVEDFDLPADRFRDLMDFIVHTRKNHPIRANYGCEGFLGAYEGKARDGLFWCRAGIHVGSVLADGSISACPSLRGDYIQGNIYQDDFIDCWENRFDVMRNRSWTHTGICTSCDAYAWCEGNGLHLRDQATGDLARCHYNLLKEAEDVRTTP